MCKILSKMRTRRMSFRRQVYGNHDLFGSVGTVDTVAHSSSKMANRRKNSERNMKKKVKKSHLYLARLFCRFFFCRRIFFFFHLARIACTLRISCIYSIVACRRFKSSSVRPSLCINSTTKLSKNTMQLFSKTLPRGVKGSRSPMICLAR